MGRTTGGVDTVGVGTAVTAAVALGVALAVAVAELLGDGLGDGLVEVDAEALADADDEADEVDEPEVDDEAVAVPVAELDADEVAVTVAEPEAEALSVARGSTSPEPAAWTDPIGYRAMAKTRGAPTAIPIRAWRCPRFDGRIGPSSPEISSTRTPAPACRLGTATNRQCG